MLYVQYNKITAHMSKRIREHRDLYDNIQI